MTNLEHINSLKDLYKKTQFIQENAPHIGYYGNPEDDRYCYVADICEWLAEEYEPKINFSDDEIWVAKAIKTLYSWAKYIAYRKSMNAIIITDSDNDNDRYFTYHLEPKLFPSLNEATDGICYSLDDIINPKKVYDKVDGSVKKDDKSVDNKQMDYPFITNDMIKFNELIKYIGDKHYKDYCKMKGIRNKDEEFAYAYAVFTQFKKDNKDLILKYKNDLFPLYGLPYCELRKIEYGGCFTECGLTTNNKENRLLETFKCFETFYYWLYDIESQIIRLINKDKTKNEQNK